MSGKWEVRNRRQVGGGQGFEARHYSRLMPRVKGQVVLVDHVGDLVRVQ